MIGRTLSHYRVLEEIGRGGMGVVYRALDTTLGREVALKVLGAAAGREPEQERRLKQEARAAASLAHPAVSVVYEIDEAEGATFIAMELVRGRPLAALLAGAPLEPGRALDLAIEVAEGLAEAHSRGVVHRDLKPKNVMLTESGHVEDHRLRPGQAPAAAPALRERGRHPRLGRHRPRPHPRHRRLHVARAGPGHGGGRPQRPLRLRRAALRDAVGRAGLPPGDRGRDAARRAQGAGAAAASRRGSTRRRRSCSASSTAASPRPPPTATPRPPTSWPTCVRRAAGWPPTPARAPRSPRPRPRARRRRRPGRCAW